MLFNLPLDKITPDVIKQLRDDSVPEGQHLDYKEVLPDPRDDKKKTDLLVDVAAFANGGGGDLVFGVAADSAHGAPTSIEGLAGFAGYDAELRRLQQVIAAGIAPRVLVQGHVVGGYSKGPVFILRIPRSWNGPHMVTKDDGTRFHVRRNAQNMAMTIQEIRSAFIGAEDLPRRIRQFRDARLTQIVSGETPAQLPQTAFCVLHLIPLQAMLRNEQLDVVSIRKRDLVPPPMLWRSYGTRYNLDGVVAVSTDSPSCGYTQVFRNGIVEAVLAKITVDGPTGCVALWVEAAPLKVLPKALSMYREINLEPPVVVMLSIVGVRGIPLLIPQSFGFNNRPIDRDVLLLPDVTVDSLDVDPKVVLRPIFDAMWQAAGFERSLCYDEAGVRLPNM